MNPTLLASPSTATRQLLCRCISFRPSFSPSVTTFTGFMVSSEYYDSFSYTIHSHFQNPILSTTNNSLTVRTPVNRIDFICMPRKINKKASFWYTPKLPNKKLYVLHLIRTPSCYLTLRVLSPLPLASSLLSADQAIWYTGPTCPLSAAICLWMSCLLNSSQSKVAQLTFHPSRSTTWLTYQRMQKQLFSHQGKIWHHWLPPDDQSFLQVTFSL